MVCICVCVYFVFIYSPNSFRNGVVKKQMQVLILPRFSVVFLKKVLIIYENKHTHTHTCSRGAVAQGKAAAAAAVRAKINLLTHIELNQSDANQTAN